VNRLPLTVHRNLYKDCCLKNVMQAYYFIFFRNFFKVGFAEVKLFPTFAVPNDTLGITKKVNGEIAQLVEHRTENPCVGGSSPPFTTTTLYKPLAIN
jgi:hypothetical protein